MNAQQTRKIPDVVVVGAGPVGTSTALKLAHRGLHVVLVESNNGPHLESRASTFHPPTLEMLDEIGLAQPLIDLGIRVDNYQLRDHRLGLIADLDLGLLSGDTRFPFRVQLEQSRLTEIAAERAEKHPRIDVVYGATVDGVHINDDMTATTTWTMEDGSHESRTSRWVVGADGSHSAVRAALNIPFTGRTYPERYLVVYTRLPLQDLIPGLAPVAYIADPQAWHVLLHTPDSWRVLIPVGVDEPEEDLLATNFCEAALARVIPGLDNYPVHFAHVYRVHRRAAETFRHGPVALVGDAAHVNNPIGGMGMNSGVHDGLLLADVIASNATDNELERRLDEWALRRREVALSFVGAQTEQNWEALRETDEERRTAQHSEWRRIAATKEATREYLLNACMIASVRPSLDDA